MTENRFYIKNHNICCENTYLLEEELCNLLNSLDMQCERLQEENEQLRSTITHLEEEIGER